MSFDYKKEYKSFYMPPVSPVIVQVPKMNFIAIRGKGNPNDEEGEYKTAVGLLYAVSYTLKMSYKGEHQIKGYFEYVVPPLEGFWWQDGIAGVDYSNKDSFNWISVIRVPDFIAETDFQWAVEEATRKKKLDFSNMEFWSHEEGLCVQCMHIGSFDNEPETVRAMEEFASLKGYVIDLSDTRLHHEIYLSDPRKVDVSKLKTVIRHPIKEA